MRRSFISTASGRRRNRTVVVQSGTVKDRLPCADGFSFDAEVNYVWKFRRRSDDEAAGLEAVVRSHILQWLGELTKGGSVLRSEMIESKVNSEFRHALPAFVGSATVMAVRAVLRVDQESEEVARELDLAYVCERREALDRRRAKERIEFFRSEILKDPASARLYLLLESPITAGVISRQEEVERLVDAVAAWHPYNRWVHLTSLFREFFADQPVTAVEAVVRDFREILSLHHRDDLVAEFDKIDFSFPAVEEP